MQQGAEEFITQRAAAQRYRIAPITIRRQVRKGLLPMFVNPIDKRVTLHRVADLEQMMKLRPAAPQETAA